MKWCASAGSSPRPCSAAARQATPLRTLTPRVLRLIAEGLSNTEIADRLRDRTQAVVTAYESGLVVPRSSR